MSSCSTSTERPADARGRELGCAELAGLNGTAAAELGEIELGTRPGHRDRDEITVYKAMGHVIEDIVAADLVTTARRGNRADGGAVICDTAERARRRAAVAEIGVAGPHE